MPERAAVLHAAGNPAGRSRGAVHRAWPAAGRRAGADQCRAGRDRQRTRPDRCRLGRRTSSRPPASSQENLEAAGIAPGEDHQGRVHPRPCRSPVGRDRRFRRRRALPECELRDLGGGMGFLDAIPTPPARVPDWLKGMARGSARILKRSESKIERRKAGDAVAPGLTLCRDARPYAGPYGGAGRKRRRAADDRRRRADQYRDLVRAAGLAHRQRFRPRPRGRHPQAPARPIGDRRIPLVGFHLPWPGIGMVETSGTAYRFVPPR